MATSKKEGYVSINVPRGNDRADPNLFIGINGVNYLLPRGKKSEVPPEVAEEFNRSEAAKAAFYDSVDALSNKD